MLFCTGLKSGLPHRQTDTDGDFKTRVLIKILGPKREEVTEDTRKLHTEKLHDLYSPNITRAFKSRRMRWRAYSTHGEKINKHAVSLENLKEEGHL